MQSAPDRSAGVRWIGLVAGPLLAALCLLWLPDQYEGALGAAVELSPQMSDAGMGLNLIGVALVTLVAYTVVVPLFGIDPTHAGGRG